MKGQDDIAQGDALGNVPSPKTKALKGRNTSDPRPNVYRKVPHISRGFQYSSAFWIFRPFRASGSRCSLHPRAYTLGYDIPPLRGFTAIPVLPMKGGPLVLSHLEEQVCSSFCAAHPGTKNRAWATQSLCFKMSNFDLSIYFFLCGFLGLGHGAVHPNKKTSSTIRNLSIKESLV